MEGRFFALGSITTLPSREGEDGALRVSAAPPADPADPMHDPTLEPRDEAVFLLTAAAEIEHALMVQYLYAAYSVRVVDGDPNREQLAAVQDLLIQIAREEMGHLATVQNLLHLVGGPLNFNREHSPYASEIYPFRFTLEPLTLESLSKYVTAESPAELPSEMSDEERALVEQIHLDADIANGQEVRHVGPIFERLAHLFSEDLADADIRRDTYAQQAKFPDWGFEPPDAAAGEPLIVASFPDTDAGLVREAAVTAVRAIGAQGEGFEPGPVDSESHFERFFDIYQRVKALLSAEAVITWPVVTNPNTTPVPSAVHGAANAVQAALEEHANTGRITHPRALAWAHLFNLRYRLLLGQLSHLLRLDHELYSDAPGPRLGDRTDRGLLLIGTFDEMRHLKKIAGKLVQLPKDKAPGPVHAGPPFELPYTLNLPDSEPQRWRMHLDASRAAVRLVREKLQPDDAATDADGFLTDLVSRDTDAQVLMQSLAEGSGVPPESLPTGFKKLVTILEEAVRGFSIGAHSNFFWAGQTREQFLAVPVPFQPVKLNPDGTVDRNPDTAPLVQRLEGTAEGKRMPRFRPPVPEHRIGFVRQWIAEGGPDETPGEIGVKHERDPKPEPVTAQDPLSFESDIKNLFRANPDRARMLFRFDLHRYEDVRDHAINILTRLNEGTMPCDNPWPPE
ncbi:MAG: ferritin-like domain-containing protein, partial [Pseudonocardiaceae bacterium]